MGYQNLILGIGHDESADVCEILVAGSFEEGGWDTPREALTHFRECLALLVKESVEEEENEGVCAHCSRQNATPLDRYCGSCGRKLKGRELNLNAETAQRFRDWFGSQLHEFRDWEALADQGWEVGGRLAPGGFIRVSGFEQMLEDWEPNWDKVEWSCGQIQVDG